MKKIMVPFIFFLLLSSSASAFEDCVERYPTGAYSDYWDSSIQAASSITKLYDSTYNTSVLKLKVANYYGTTGIATLKTIDTIDTVTYVSVITRTVDETPSLNIGFLSSSDSVIASIGTTAVANTKYEAVWSASYLKLYANGSLISTVDTGAQENVKIRIQASSYYSAYVEIDDIATGSIIGIPTTITESDDNLRFTYSGQLMRNYDTPYNITLYSITNTNNTGKVTSWNIGNSPEFGQINEPRVNILGYNFGLYMLEISRENDILTDQYFYYDQLSNPQGFPEVLFLAETDTAAEIRDEDNNGGIISGGSSVYLYPDEKEDGYYNFTIDFSEPSYSRRVELTKIYNTTTLNGSILSYSGLTENYNVSRDSTQIGQTNGSDSWDNTVTWIGQDSYIYEFEPDYSLPGFWGYVKNSETQTAIKSATVSITNGTDTFYVYTDENGMYYQTQEIATGETYTVQAKKTNYESSNPYNLTTTAGATTRQDLYLSKASGSGVYYAPHDVGFTVLEYWYSGAGLSGVSYTISSEDDGELKTGTTDSKGMFTGSDMTGGTNYTIVLTYDGKTYNEYVEPSLTEYTFVLNKEGVLHQYANSWLTLSYTENTNNVTIAYDSNKTITGASLTAIANNGTTVYSQTLTTDTGSFTFETGGEGDYTLNFHIQATDGDTASQSWGLSYPNKVPLFPDEYPAWLKNILFSGIVIVFLLSFGKAKNDIACGAVAILTSMGYIFEWFTCSFYFVVLVWIIALGAVFLHYKRTGGIG